MAPPRAARAPSSPAGHGFSGDCARQLQRKPNSFQPSLPHLLGQCDEILCRADSAMPAAAERGDAGGPAFRVAIDGRNDVGAERVTDITQIFPAFSEDFGAFQERVPGVYYFLGVANAAKGYAGMPHAPDYVADEGAMLVGARAMAAVILDRLATP